MSSDYYTHQSTQSCRENNDDGLFSNRDSPIAMYK